MKITQHNISNYALKNLISSYVTHKRQMELYEIEYEDDMFVLEENGEYMFHKGCVETAESFMNSIGVSPSSNYVMDMYREEIKREI